MTTYTFNKFLKLPAELRAQIWELAIEPRIVKVQRVYLGAFQYRFAPTSAPAILQACQEARNHLHRLYQRVFLDGSVVQISTQKVLRRQYVWLNWNIDMISITKFWLPYVMSIAPLVRHLQLERDSDDEWWTRAELHWLHDFVNATEIYFVWRGVKMDSCHDVFKNFPWPCNPENVFLVYANHGQIMTLGEMEEKCDRD